MRVDLGDDAEIDVEVCVQRLEGDVGPQTPVLPFVAERVRRQSAGAGFHHQHDGIQDARHRGRGEDGGPDHAVGRRQIIGQDGRGMRVGGHTGDVQNPPGPLVRFAEGGAAPAEPAPFSSPLDGVEACPGTPPSSRPDVEGVLARGDVVREGRDEEALELVVRASGDQSGHYGPA